MSSDRIARLSVADRWPGAALLRPPRPDASDGVGFTFVGTGSKIAAPPLTAPRPRRVVWFSTWQSGNDERWPGDDVDDFADGWTALLTPERVTNKGFDDLDLDAQPPSGDGEGPVLVVTIDRTRWTGIGSLLRASGPAERQALKAPGYEWGIGAARPPIFSTLTIWESAAHAAAYAHGANPSGHRDAIAAEQRKKFFKRWAVMRFRVNAERGVRPPVR